MTPELSPQKIDAQKSTDPTDIVIHHKGHHRWLANGYQADFDDVSISFQNKSSEHACRVTFDSPQDGGLTFGTRYIGLAPGGTISVNILNRNHRTPFHVTDLDRDEIITDGGGGQTIIIDS